MLMKGTGDFKSSDILRTKDEYLRFTSFSTDTNSQRSTNNTEKILEIKTSIDDAGIYI